MKSLSISLLWLFLTTLCCLLCEGDDQTCTLEEGKDVEGSLEQRLVDVSEKLNSIEQRMKAVEEQLRRLEFEGGSRKKTTSLQSVTSTDGVTGSPGFEIQPYGEGSGKTLLRRRETFHDHFDLMSVVKTDGKLTSMTSISSTKDKKIEMVVLGDDLGKVYVFEPRGDLMAEHHTGTPSPIVDFACYSQTSKIWIIGTCHINGEVRLHVLMLQSRSSGNALEVEKISFNRTLIEAASSEEDKRRPPIRIFAVKLRSKRRFLISYEDGRSIVVTVNGTVVHTFHLPSPIFNVRSDTHRVLMGHKGGLAIHSGKDVKDLPCSKQQELKLELRSLLFDVDRVSRVFAVDVHDSLLVMGINPDDAFCTVRHRVSMPLPGSSFSLASIKGYLLIGSTEGVAVLNTTLAAKSGPREILSDPFSYITGPFRLNVDRVDHPMLSASHKGDVVAVHLDKAVGIFRSRLYLAPLPDLNMGRLYRPLFFVALVLVVLWKICMKQWNRRPVYDPNIRATDQRDWNRWNYD